MLQTLEMKKKLSFLLCLMAFSLSFAQELLASVTVNSSQVAGTNTQVYKSLEKNLRDFINNTSWTGKKLQNFEKIKCNFAIVISERMGNNSFKGSLVVQSARPVYGTTYESPMLNLNDTNFAFDYTENENLVFNERQFSGKNLTDVISFYIYIILGYDADSFQNLGGKLWFEKAQKISQNSQNQKFSGWSSVEGPKTRANLIENILKPDNAALRNVYYYYHRNGLDNLAGSNANQAKKSIADALFQLKSYENNFQMNYPFNVFIDAKRDEIFKIFEVNSTAAVNMAELKALMSTFSPKDIDTKWNKWK